MDHPDAYVMSRDEWLEVNRVLARCSLGLRMPGNADAKAKRRDRLQSVEYARTIMSEVYQRAAERGDDR